MHNRPRIKMIAAMGINRVIGANNQLPWHLPAEWEYFRAVTKGHVFIMGRKSYFNPDALLSDRYNYVVSRQPNLAVSGNTSVASSLEVAIDAAGAEDSIFVLGGGSIFTAALPYADELYLTIIHDVFSGDTYFPQLNWSQWRFVTGKRHMRDEEHSHTFSMNIYHRIKPSSNKVVQEEM